MLEALLKLFETTLLHYCTFNSEAHRNSRTCHGGSGGEGSGPTAAGATAVGVSMCEEE